MAASKGICLLCEKKFSVGNKDFSFLMGCALRVFVLSASGERYGVYKRRVHLYLWGLCEELRSVWDESTPVCSLISA
jgi:hypothetical protein